MATERSIASRREELLPFLRRLLITIAVLGLVALAVMLRDIWIIAFASVLVAIALRAMARGISRWTRLSARWSLAVACLLVLVVIGGTAWIAWPQIQTQLPNLFDRVAESLQQIQSTFGIQIPNTAQEIADSFTGLADQLWSVLLMVLQAIATIGSTMLLVIAGGVFIAAEPLRYHDGLVMLFPKTWHDKVHAGMEKIGDGLLLWLRAQLFAMIAVGVLTGVGAWAIGLPSPLALGLIAGFGEFIPIIGPFIAIVPAVLIAFATDTELLVWTVVVYIGVQQFEANLLTPLLNRRIVSLPPVLLLFSFVALGLLFGIPGIIVAAPLSVAIYIGIREFYVRDLLDEDELLDSDEPDTSPPEEEPPAEPKAKAKPRAARPPRERATAEPAKKPTAPRRRRAAPKTE